MQLFFRTILILSVISMTFAQNFGRIELQEDEPLVEEQTEISIPIEEMKLHPLDRMIDPELYIIGPGDEIGLSIQIDRNLTFPLTVTPTGDMFIPSVGVCHVGSMTLSEAKAKVKTFINKNAFPQAKSHMVLINPRVFKLQITGAVIKPGFVIVTPVTRLDEIVELAEGFRPLAKEFEIEIHHADGSRSEINFLDYLLTGNLENNPHFVEGDHIQIPFGEVSEDGIVIGGAIENPGFDVITPGEILGNFIKRNVIFTEEANLANISITRASEKDQKIMSIKPEDFSSTELKAGDFVDFGREHGVSVTGFVQTPGGFDYYPGYTAADYIALAGGNTIEGRAIRAKVFHRDGSSERANNAELRRGDIVFVPQTMKNYLFGTIGAIPVLVSLTSVALTYIAATK